MSEMIKRVGAAILLAQSQWNAKMAKEPLEVVVGRAAIEAMREPTDAMRAAGAEAELPASYHEPNDSYSILGEPPDPIWYAMIDEALKP